MSWCPFYVRRCVPWGGVAVVVVVTLLTRFDDKARCARGSKRVCKVRVKEFLPSVWAGWFERYREVLRWPKGVRHGEGCVIYQVVCVLVAPRTLFYDAAGARGGRNGMLIESTRAGKLSEDDRSSWSGVRVNVMIVETRGRGRKGRS